VGLFGEGHDGDGRNPHVLRELFERPKHGANVGVAIAVNLADAQVGSINTTRTSPTSIIFWRSFSTSPTKLNMALALLPGLRVLVDDHLDEVDAVEIGAGRGEARG